MLERRPLAAVKGKLGAGLVAGVLAAGALTGSMIASNSAGAATVVKGFDVSHYQGSVNLHDAVQQRRSVRLHQGDRGHHVHRPELLGQLHESYNAGVHPRRVPLRPP